MTPTLCHAAERQRERVHVHGPGERLTGCGLKVERDLPFLKLWQWNAADWRGLWCAKCGKVVERFQGNGRVR